MVLNETLDLLKTRYKRQFKTTTIKRVHVGVYFAAVQLSSGYCGLSSVDASNINCCPQNRKKEYGAFSPGQISGQLLQDLFDYEEASKVLDIVKVAAINAVSAELISTTNYTILENKDPIELVDLSGSKTICVVGAFHSYIKNISNSAANLVVLELNEAAVPEEFKKYYIPSEKASSVFPDADTIIITGSTLMNDTLDDMLDIIPPDRQVIVVGPTAGIIPDVLFKHKVNIIGSTRVLDADKVFHVIAEGGAGYHLFYNGAAQKICLLNDGK